VRLRARDKALPLSLAAGCFLLALLQRLGLASSDTKIDLHVDPGGFLGDVGAVWSPTGSLGHIQGGQYGGYLWPMGPFFALLHGLGLSPWLIQRLWLGTLLALAAWGVVRLLDALLDRRRGAAHLVAGVLFVLNPYVVVFSSRTTITLLGYAALPWLLLTVHRGLRDARGWWWPAAFALIVTSSGGGVNAAVTAWLLLGPLLLAPYEALACGVAWRDLWRFAWRVAAATAAASIWWVVPLLVQAGYGIDFLKFTEQVGSIWSTTSLTESLRLMGYWPSYLGVGYRGTLLPYFGTSPAMLFDPLVVLASLAAPGLAVWGFVWTRRWRYGPFFLLLALVALLVMSVGFPEGTPLRRAATFTYNHVGAVQFLRTTYKAGPLLALALACLGGAAFAELWDRLGGAAARARVLQVAVACGAAALCVLAALPLFQGRAVELTWKRIPAAWTRVARDLDRDLPANSRALVLPGAPFGFYRWGGTVDPILPALTNRPVAVRYVPPYDDLHAADLLTTTDNLVHQRRLLPGELPSLLDLLSARSVVTGTDDDPDRSGAMPPAEAALTLAAQPGLGAPARAYGPARTFAAPAETLDAPARLPEVRRYALGSARGLVRVEPAAGATLVDGAAEGVGALGSFGGLPAARPLLYAGDLGAGAIRREAAAGASVAITDSNRRRAFVASRPRQSSGWTLPASEPFSADASVLDPFGRGSDAQTVAVYTGAVAVRAPYSPQVAQFPEHRPYAAFDGDVATTWTADASLEPARHWVEAELPAPRDVPYVDVLPDASNPLVVVTRLDVGGRSFRVHPGWNRLRVGLRRVRTLRVTITGHRTLGRRAGSVGGIRELRVPGLRVEELLRPPVVAERALAGAGADLSHTPLSYLFERTTADDPLRRGPVPPQSRLTGSRAEDEAALVRSATDPETGLARVFSPPAARSWRADAWVTTAPSAPEALLDRLAGARTAGVSLLSSGRFEGRPGWRASSAFDGSAESAWAAPWSAGGGAWLEWTTPRPRTLGRRLVLTRSRLPARFPSSVRVSVAGDGSTPALRVRADGSILLPRALRGRRFRLSVVAAGGSVRPAVAIGELRGAGVPRVAVPRAGPLRGGAGRGRCGDLSGTLGGSAFALRVAGTVQDLDAGAALRATACGPAVALPAGRVVLRVPGGGVLRPLALRLRSPAPAGGSAGGAAGGSAAADASAGGRVLDPGRLGRGDVRGVRVEVRRPSWLVLGESYNRGWRAECDGRSLGEPRVVDAFANGWRVSPGCRDVSFSFAPQRAVTWGYAIGGVACLLLLALLLLRARARRRREAEAAAPAAPAAPPRPIPAGDGRRPLPLRHALLAGAAAGAVFGFAFALRAGVAIGPGVALLLWRGASPRLMIGAAGALLAVVVPALYLIFPAPDRGGYSTGYPVEHLGAHWVAVAAFVLLVLALARTLSTARRSSGGPAAEEAAAPAARARA
jgi:arabinofuranan 3-O-arabinosyltransferase